MTPDVGEVFGFVAWKRMTEKNMIPQVIPPSMFNTFKCNNMGVFEQLHKRWLKIKNLRYNLTYAISFFSKTKSEHDTEPFFHENNHHRQTAHPKHTAKT